jgi:hypothetical protein
VTKTVWFAEESAHTYFIAFYELHGATRQLPVVIA